MLTAQSLLGTPPIRAYKRISERIKLGRIPRSSIEPSVGALRKRAAIDLAAAMKIRVENDEESASSWQTLSDLVPANTGGINNGDRRAIYALIRHLRPARVLEIGTHIGASTAIIAQALAQNSREGSSGSLTTVDIRDVNCESARPWAQFNCRFSPREILKELGTDSHVEFVQAPSVDFLSRTTELFDLIFLDGDHSAATVYAEVPRALKLLKSNGVILLHDYFPNCKPLWRDGVVIPGPQLAVTRLREEGFEIEAEPLGALPWPTKYGSTVTSLALLIQATPKESSFENKRDRAAAG